MGSARYLVESIKSAQNVHYALKTFVLNFNSFNYASGKFTLPLLEEKVPSVQDPQVGESPSFCLCCCCRGRDSKVLHLDVAEDQGPLPQKAGFQLVHQAEKGLGQPVKKKNQLFNLYCAFCLPFAIWFVKPEVFPPLLPGFHLGHQAVRHRRELYLNIFEKTFFLW